MKTISIRQNGPKAAIEKGGTGMTYRLIAIAIAVTMLFAGAMALAGSPVMADDSDPPIAGMDDVQDNGEKSGNEDSAPPADDPPAMYFVTINPDQNDAPELIEEAMDLLEGLIIGPGS